MTNCHDYDRYHDCYHGHDHNRYHDHVVKIGHVLNHEHGNRNANANGKAKGNGNFHGNVNAHGHSNGNGKVTSRSRRGNGVSKFVTPRQLRYFRCIFWFMQQVDPIQSYLNLKIGLPPLLKAGFSSKT